MGTQSKASTTGGQGFFARLIGNLKRRFRKIFGKNDEPNIYPFF